MTAYRFRLVSAAVLFALFASAVLAFGAVDHWALMIFEVGIFGLAAVWAARLALSGIRPVWNPLYVPLGVLTLWTILQSGLSLSVHPYQTTAEGLKWLAMLLMFIIAAHVFTDISIQRGFRLGLVWFGFALCTFGLVQHFTSEHLIYWTVPVQTGRVFGPFVNSNHFTSLLELILPAALLLALERSETRLIYVAVSGMILAAVVACASRAGIVIVGLETVAVLALRAVAPTRSRRKLRLGPALAAAGAAALVLFLILGPSPLARKFEEENPYQMRWSVAQVTWKLFLSRPWTGYGAGTFEQVYPSYAPLDLGLNWTNAHNDPLQFAMEWGVLGVGALATILFLMLRVRWRRDVWSESVVPVLAVLAHSWFDFPLQIPAVLAAWLLILAALNPASASAKQVPQESPS